MMKFHNLTIQELEQLYPFEYQFYYELIKSEEEKKNNK